MGMYENKGPVILTPQIVGLPHEKDLNKVPKFRTPPKSGREGV